ncbi:MAG: putative LPS assembly protein LptD [Bacteroides sp.]
MKPHKAKYLLYGFIFFFMFLPILLMGKGRKRSPILPKPISKEFLRTDSLGTDSVSSPRGSTAPDSLVTDSLLTDSLIQKKKEPIDAPVEFESSDSIVYEFGGLAHLYGSSKVTYEQIELDADLITMNLDSSNVYARGLVDSLGGQTNTVFKDGESSYDTKGIRYNFKTEKGFITNIVTQQGEGYVTSYQAKKGSGDEFFMQNGRYTTCDRHDHPHFYMQLTRAKVRPKKNVVTGPAYLVVEDVPLPIAVPFFFFPFSSSYSSGFILPSYMDDYSRGFGLSGGGYYFAISDMMDLKLLTDVFTKGSWAIRAQTNYNRRYKYSGNLMADYQVTKTGDKGLDDYMVAKDFKIVWSHRQDPKASPNSSFSASVNFATSSYERSNINNLYNSNLLTQNTKTSSVNYTRSFPDQKLTLSSTFNIAQTTRDSSVAITLPDLNISLSRVFPFKRKKAAGEERWYEKISLSYTGRFSNTLKTKDDMIFKSNLKTDWENAMNHNIPISATFTLFKYFNITPSFNYRERWYTRKVMREYDPVRGQLMPTDTVYGFNRVYDYNASLGLSTKVYGRYRPLFMKKKEIDIRHVITPQVTISAAPDFGASRYGYYEKYTDNRGEEQYYSPYQGQMFGVPGRGKQGNISFDLSNNLEMKYRDRNDSVRKVSLIDELGGSISYNAAAETKRWSDLSFRLRLKLSKNYTLNMNTQFATYAYQFDENGRVYVGDKTEWSYGRFGRFRGWGSSFSYTFDNNSWKKWFGKKEEDSNDKSKAEGSDLAHEEGDGTEKKKKKVKPKVSSDGYQAFSMPWSVNINYSFNISEDTGGMDPKKINPKTMRFPYKYTHNINASGNLRLSNKWAFNFTTGYDFEAKKVTQTSCNITRDLHCFSMTASFSPFGVWKYYNFTIRANASMLQDLKWEQRSQTQSNIEWY